jgi:hypothetical protein
MSRVLVFGFLIVLTLGNLACNRDDDRFTRLEKQFPALCAEMNQIHQVAAALSVSDEIVGIEMGTAYNHTPDVVILSNEETLAYEDVLSKKRVSNMGGLDQFRSLAKKVGARAIRLDNNGLLWVVMYSGRNNDWGYVYTNTLAITPLEVGEVGRYVAIPEEQHWYSFRR